MSEALSELSCPQMVPMQIGKTGMVVTQMDIADTYEIYPQGSAMFIDFELDRHIDMYHGSSSSPTAEIKTAFQYGSSRLQRPVCWQPTASLPQPIISTAMDCLRRIWITC